MNKNKLFCYLKKCKVIFGIIIIIISAGIIGAKATAQTKNRAANIKSTGNFDYGNGTVVISSEDLVYLANEIDLLEDTYKTETVKALDQMGTYFTSDSLPTHNMGEDNLPYSDANLLPFSAIINGIIYSQSIPTERTYTGILPGEKEEISGNISEATAENLSLGTAAWVDGKLIVGTGIDNNNYYNEGYLKGVEEALNSHQIEYIYHHHSESCSTLKCKVTHVMEPYGDTQTRRYYIHENCGEGILYETEDYPCEGRTETYFYHTVYNCGFSEGQIEGATIMLAK